MGLSTFSYSVSRPLSLENEKKGTPLKLLFPDNSWRETNTLNRTFRFVSSILWILVFSKVVPSGTRWYRFYVAGIRALLEWNLKVTKKGIGQAEMGQIRVFGWQQYCWIRFSHMWILFVINLNSVPGDLFYLCWAEPISMRCHAHQ